jgi:uroporphyrinogen III methyltransferase/synthase
VVPSEFVAEALARRLKVGRGERVLLPRAAQARDVLPRALRRRGAVVDVVPAYRTAPDPAGRRRLRGLLLGPRPPHWVSFTSSSTVEGLSSLFTRAEWRRIFARTRAACIGPVTERTLRRLGVRPAARARSYTAKGLAEAIRRRHA